MGKFKKCEECGKESKTKDLGRINGKLLCKKCQRAVRLKHREQTIKEAGIGEELKALKIKAQNESQKKCYKAKKVLAWKPKKLVEGIPTIKDSSKIKKEKSQAFITQNEKKSLYTMLIKRGLESKHANERIKTLIESQKELRAKLKLKNKSEEEIKLNEQKLLEELWNY